MEDDNLSSMPADELADVLDMVIWTMGRARKTDVEMWRKELLARPDADAEDVKQAIAICDEFLAPPGSQEEHDAAVRAWGEDTEITQYPPFIISLWTC